MTHAVRDTPRHGRPPSGSYRWKLGRLFGWRPGRVYGGLLLVAAVATGCQPGAATPQRATSAAAPATPSGAIGRPLSTSHAENAAGPRPAEGNGPTAPGDPPANGSAVGSADAAAAEPDAEVEAARGDPRGPATAATQALEQTGGEAQSELLLLDDEPLALADAPDDSPTAAADNSRCFHCHLNYVDEQLAVTHARAKIGCADCHGNCDAHIADESWASGGNGTPPGIMYPREKINPFCLDCHAREKIEGDQHEALFAGTSKEKYCTDCHGDHRLTQRKCKWK